MYHINYFKIMKNKILLQLIRMTKFALFGIFLQCFFISMLLASTGKAQAIQPVSEVFLDIGFENEPLKDVFKSIEKQTKYHFSFYEEINLNDEISIQKKQRSVSDLLLVISRLKKLSFKQVNNVISVKPSTGIAPEKEIEVIIQTRTVTGKVTSMEDNEGLPGVNVVEKGTSNGTVTDVQGNYSLKFPQELHWFLVR